MGTIETLSWQYFSRTEDALEYFLEKGFQIYAVETTRDAVNLFQFDHFLNSAFIFGNEEFGIKEEILKQCSGVVKIPLVGMKNSINVANSFSVVMAEMLRNLF